MDNLITSKQGKYLLALATGAILTFMMHFNGQLAAGGTVLFSSWTAHGTGTLVSLVFVGAIIWKRGKLNRKKRVRAPLWAYTGGLLGALIVILTSTTVNTALALSGTLALGLTGQMLFSLCADHWGLLGLPKRKTKSHEIVAMALITLGSFIIIFYGQG